LARDDDSPFPDDDAVKKVVVKKITAPKGSKKASNTGAVQKTKTRMGRKNIKTKKKASAPFKRKFKG
jgi:hypothetical protein